MTGTLYLRDAFGWHSEYTAKVAFAQLAEIGDEFIDSRDCPQKQFIEEGSSHHGLWNSIKILGYVPGMNVITGIFILKYCGNRDPAPSRSHDKQLWMLRGVAMIFTGPLLIVIDLIKFIYDCRIASKYRQEYPERVGQFDPTHPHTTPFWPGHPVECEDS